MKRQETLSRFRQPITRTTALPIAPKAAHRELDVDQEDFKSIGQIRVIGDKRGGEAMLRWSDDDYQTSSSCRPVQICRRSAAFWRCGRFVGEVFELCCIADLPVQLESLELG